VNDRQRKVLIVGLLLSGGACLGFSLAEQVKNGSPFVPFAMAAIAITGGLYLRAGGPEPVPRPSNARPSVRRRIRRALTSETTLIVLWGAGAGILGILASQISTYGWRGALAMGGQEFQKFLGF